MRSLAPRHRDGEAAIPASARPVQRPTGVPARRLGCTPGTAAAVLADLREADAPSHAEPLAWLLALLAEPLPATDWTDVLDGVAASTLRRLTCLTATIHNEQMAQVTS